MNRKYTSFTILLLLLATLIFLVLYDNEPQEVAYEPAEAPKFVPERIRRAGLAPRKPCPYDLTDPALYHPSKLTKIQLRYWDKAVEIPPDGLVRRPLSRYKNQIHANGTTAIEWLSIMKATMFSAENKLPDEVASSIKDWLTSRIGTDAFQSLRFVQAYHFTPPVHGKQMWFFDRKIDSDIAYIILYAVDNLVQGVKTYEFPVALNDKFEVIDAEIPEIPDGQFRDHMVSIHDIVAKGKKRGLFLIRSDNPLLYRDGKILLLLESPLIHHTRFYQNACSGLFDLRTGKLIGPPTIGTEIAH